MRVTIQAGPLAAIHLYFFSQSLPEIMETEHGLEGEGSGSANRAKKQRHTRKYRGLTCANCRIKKVIAVQIGLNSASRLTTAIMAGSLRRQPTNMQNMRDLPCRMPLRQTTAALPGCCDGEEVARGRRDN